MNKEIDDAIQKIHNLTKCDTSPYTIHHLRVILKDVWDNAQAQGFQAGEEHLQRRVNVLIDSL